ncbi:MAG TPA: hypothetical protein VM095_01285 [Pyrinomonadaceae bacterium]|nr:hypothetical protein [Pyrinomonadaceae bacterium]
MEIISFRNWKLRADSYQTELAYQTIVGTTRSCQCHWCANFVAAREEIYPSEILAVLTDLGIDHTKEADLYQQARDTQHQTILYRWWFYGIGYIEEGPQAWEYMGHEQDKVPPAPYWDKHLESLREDPRYFGVGFSDSARRRASEEHFVPDELKPYNLVQVELNAEVPWVLSTAFPSGL